MLCWDGALMQHILSPNGEAALASFVGAGGLLAFDYDGTLAPIVAHPERAALRPATRELLEQVVARYPSIVVSGRLQADVLKRVRGLKFREVIGNHGLEP